MDSLTQLYLIEKTELACLREAMRASELVGKETVDHIFMVAGLESEGRIRKTLVDLASETTEDTKETKQGENNG